MKAETKGGIIIEDIQIGDIHYEFEYNVGIEVTVTTEPVRNSDGLWEWEAESVKTGKTIYYAVHEDYSHYGPKLYGYKAYTVSHWI